MQHHNTHHKPDLPILAPRPLKQSIGSPVIPRKHFLPAQIVPSQPTEVPTSVLSIPSPRISESFDEKPEIRELYVAAEEELKEIVEGFTHTFVNNLMREGSQRRNHFFEDDDEEDETPSMMDDEYFSPFCSSTPAFEDDDESPIFTMEDLPRLGGSPSPMPAERESLSSDIRNYSFLDDDFDDTAYFPSEEQGLWEYYQDGEEEGEYYEYDEEEADIEETRRLFNESRWMTETPPARASNPVSKNTAFGRRLIVVTSKNVVAPSEPEERMNEWRQRRKRIMSEPPQKAASFTSIECY